MQCASLYKRQVYPLKLICSVLYKILMQCHHLILENFGRKCNNISWVEQIYVTMRLLLFYEMLVYPALRMKCFEEIEVPVFRELNLENGQEGKGYNRSKRE